MTHLLRWKAGFQTLSVSRYVLALPGVSQGAGVRHPCVIPGNLDPLCYGWIALTARYADVPIGWFTVSGTGGTSGDRVSMASQRANKRSKTHDLSEGFSFVGEPDSLAPHMECIWHPLGSFPRLRTSHRVCLSSWSVDYMLASQGGKACEPHAMRIARNHPASHSTCTSSQQHYLAGKYTRDGGGNATHVGLFLDASTLLGR